MRTILTCLAIGLIALIIGLARQSRVADLERLVAANEAALAAKHAKSSPESRSLIRPERRKSAERKSASEVLHYFINREDIPTQITSGAYAAIDNKPGFEEVLKLDLAGQHEFIKLVAESDSKAFGGDLYRCEAINLCLCAMADRNPELALDYLVESDSKIGKFYGEWMAPSAMASYSLLRISQENPQLAAARLAQIADNDWQVLEGGGNISEIINTIADSDLALAAETIGKLPEAHQTESWRTLIQNAKTKDHSTQTLNAFRANPPSDPAIANGLIGPLFFKLKGPETPWNEFQESLAELNLDETEISRYAPAISQTRQLGEEPEVANWLLNHLPPSQDREFLLWQTTQGFWEAKDPAGVAKFLQEQKIDPEEMTQLRNQPDRQLMRY
ncbi:hypothetical protein ACFQY0_06785 [Haloferula chungangensis]|uniref:HEAT repeat domain-containing protein n=1 Tax=Haloferula chungangensis TaxID=1048331 RepID=A0ABW2L720_9BACT